MTIQDEDKKAADEHTMKLNAICNADNWWANLPRQEQIYVEEIAGKVASQVTVMRYQGDQRRGLDVFPDAWKVVVKPSGAPPTKFIQKD